MSASIGGLELIDFVCGAPAATITGTTTETELARYVLPACALGKQGRFGKLEIETFWTVNNNANAKNCRTRLGGMAGGMLNDFNATAALTLRQMVSAFPRSDTSVWACNWMTVGASSTNMTVVRTTDFRLDQPIVFTGQLAVGTDSLTLEAWSVKVWRPN